MKRALLVFAAMLTAGCEYREPQLTSAEIQRFAAEHPGITPACLNDIRWGRRNWDLAVDDSECFEMLPPQRWSGLWDHGWEWSNFCPKLTRQQCHWDDSSLDEAPRGTWLTFSESAHLPRDLPDGIHRTEFIGRRTRVPATFGHLGDYEHLMVVDYIISIQTIPGEKYTKRF